MVGHLDQTLHQCSPQRTKARKNDSGVHGQSITTVSSAYTGPCYLANSHEQDSTPNNENKTNYHINCRQTRRLWASLIDRGANGGIAGTDTRVIDTTSRTIDLSGIDDHTVRNLPIVTAGGVVRSNRGEIILIMNAVSYTHLTLPTICSV